MFRAPLHTSKLSSSSLHHDKSLGFGLETNAEDVSYGLKQNPKPPKPEMPEAEVRGRRWHDTPLLGPRFRARGAET